MKQTELIETKEDKKHFYRSVFSLVLPLGIQNLINAAVASADVVMLGRVSEASLSACSLAGQVQFIMTLFFFGLTSGAAVLTAQYWGKKDVRTIEKIMGVTLRFSLIVSVGFTLAVWLFPVPIMHIFSSEPEVIAQGARYLRIVGISYTTMGFTIIYLNIMRSVERVLVSTVVYTISLAVNILLNYVFIFGKLGLPAMGIQGAALATTLARLLELVIVLFYAYNKKNVVRLHFSDLFVRDQLLFKDFVHYSIPVTINELMWGIACSLIAVVIGHLGSAVVAANSVAQVARQLATVVAFGIGNAAAILVGKTIGANKIKLAERYARRLVVLTLITSAIGSVLILIARPYVVAGMNVTEEARGYLSMMMYVMSYFVIGQAYNTTMIVGIFRSGGDSKFGLILDLSTMWTGSICLGALSAFVFKWPVPVVYMILMSDEIVKIPITTWRYRTKKWLRNVTR